MRSVARDPSTRWNDGAAHMHDINVRLKCLLNSTYLAKMHLRGRTVSRPLRQCATQVASTVWPAVLPHPVDVDMHSVGLPSPLLRVHRFVVARMERAGVSLE